MNIEPSSTSSNVTTDVATVDREEIPPRHHQIARLVALGFNHRQIAERLMMAENSISVISRSPLFKMVVRELQEELDKGVKRAQSTLVEAAPKAAEKLVEMMENPDLEGTRLKRDICLDVMKASGVVKADDKPQLNLTINENKLELIFQTLKEMKR